MTRPGYRFGVSTRPRTGDLARKAVVVGVVLAAAVVLLAALAVVWAPSEDGTRQASGVEGFVGPAMAKKDKSSDSKDDSGSDDGDDSSGSGHSRKKSDSSRKSGSSKSRSSGDGSDADSSGSTSSSSSDGSSSGAGPTGTANSGSGGSTGGNGGPRVNISCTKEVTDEAGLKEALASAGPNDVICVKGGLGRGPAATATPTPSSPAPLGLPVPSGGPTSTCGHPENCTQSNTTSGPSTGAGSSGGQKRTSTQPSGGSTGGPMEPASTGLTGPPGATTPKQDNCTKQVDGAGLDQAVRGASPGDRICVTGDSTDRLEITKGGSDQAPIVIIGNGKSSVKGITVKANNVVVDGFQVLGAQAPGIELTGNNITAQNNTVKHPTGGDFDGLRFFGNNIKVLHNTISDINPNGGSAHADCMQTFTSGKPSSQHVLIDGNRCEKIANICLMAEGPGDVGDGGGGDGTSADWTFSNNVCEFGASQGVMVEAVQNVTVRNNQFEGKSDKAIGLDLGSTGATVAANLLGEGIDHEVGMDSKSRQGYHGPAPGGGP
ncbi:MAG: right-handed parallel beta-helix repeat-containing protein [Pseudonocardia sp.]|nr:right-handed parallel beta-helix repeat-containing protein [Pseudonocardia sp.]